MILDFLLPKNRNKTREKISCDYFFMKDIGYSCLENAFILPYSKDKGEGCIIDKNGNFLKKSTLNASFNMGGYRFDKAKVKYINNNAIFIGTLYSVFGHVITDDLKKIWFLQTDKARRLLAEGADIVYISFHGQELKPYVEYILALAGISLKKAKCVDSIVSYKNVYVPDDSIVSNNKILCYTKEFKSIVDHIIQQTFECKSLQHIKADKIYLSRTSLKNRRDYGENAVENVFRKKGYVIIHPENLTFENQISLYRSATEIVTTEGSISHMFLFCKPHTKVVILKKANYINDYQMMINALSEVDAVFIDANHTIPHKNVWNGPFYLSVTKNLSKYLGIRRIDIFLFKIDFYFYFFQFLKMIIKCYVK